MPMSHTPFVGPVAPVPGLERACKAAEPLCRKYEGAPHTIIFSLSLREVQPQGKHSLNIGGGGDGGPQSFGMASPVDQVVKTRPRTMNPNTHAIMKAGPAANSIPSFAC